MATFAITTQTGDILMFGTEGHSGRYQDERFTNRQVQLKAEMKPSASAAVKSGTLKTAALSAAVGGVRAGLTHGLTTGNPVVGAGAAIGGAIKRTMVGALGGYAINKVYVSAQVNSRIKQIMSSETANQKIGIEANKDIKLDTNPQKAIEEQKKTETKKNSTQYYDSVQYGYEKGLEERRAKINDAHKALYESSEGDKFFDNELKKAAEKDWPTAVKKYGWENTPYSKQRYINEYIKDDLGQSHWDEIEKKWMKKHGIYNYSSDEYDPY